MFPKSPKLLHKFKYLFSNENLLEFTKTEDLKIITDETMITSKQLHASLKQLEFISFFETHIDTRQEKSYSLSFLQEFAEIKRNSQLNTIELLSCQSV